MRDLLRQLYARVWDTAPRKFQLDVAEQLLAGAGATVLRAPTGAGKTRAALLAPLLAWDAGHPFVDRVLYAVPLRALATSLAIEARAAVAKLGLDLRVTLQIGGAEEDPVLDRGHITFMTIDQLLSRYLALPYSLGPRRANMCPGALIGSLIVLDEVHLLEPSRALATSVVMLGRHLRRCSPFLVMSATLTSSAVGALSSILDAPARIVTEEETVDWPGFADIERTVCIEDEPLDACQLIRSLASDHWPRRVLVVVNTVARAQALYEELRDASHPYSIGLLHSRYLSSDRTALETPLLSRFGRGPQEQGHALLVATQVVEVGLDISSDRMHTELAPANALVQRLGRCARWPGERGCVHVHPPVRDDSGRWKLGPYVSDRTVVEATWRRLHDSLERRMSSFVADELVEFVHAEDDRKVLAAIDIPSVEREIERAVDDGEVAIRKARIRDVDSVSVLVLPSDTLPDPRGVAEWISVPRSSLYGAAIASGRTLVWSAQFDNESGDSWGRWIELPFDPGLVREATLLVLPNTLASYDAQVGLKLTVPGTPTPVRQRCAAERPRYGYVRETYLDHVRRVLVCGEQLEHSSFESPDEPGVRRPGMAVALGQMDSLFAGSGVTRMLARLACALHDVGKLSLDWYKWAQAWQRARGVEEIEALAHTDANPYGDAPRGLPQRPPHAVASALACEQLVWFAVDALMPTASEARRTAAGRAVLSAIARHHSPRATAGTPCRFIDSAGLLVRRSLEIAGLPEPPGEEPAVYDVTSRTDIAEFGEQLALRLSGGGENRSAMLLYWVLVRYLRTADGHSQAFARVEEA